MWWSWNMKHSASHGGLKMLRVNHFLQACHNMSNSLLWTCHMQTVCSSHMLHLTCGTSSMMKTSCTELQPVIGKLHTYCSCCSGLHIQLSYWLAEETISLWRNTLYEWREGLSREAKQILISDLSDFLYKVKKGEVPCVFTVRGPCLWNIFLPTTVSQIVATYTHYCLLHDKTEICNWWSDQCDWKTGMWSECNMLSSKWKECPLVPYHDPHMIASSDSQGTHPVGQ